MEEFWDDIDDGRAGPPLAPGAARAAESALGYRLPESYLRLLRARNGGTPRHRCFPAASLPAWANDHVRIACLLGIGTEGGIDGRRGSEHLIRKWGYPDVGIVIAETPSAGYDAVMLDYSECGPRGEPRVIHVEVSAAGPAVTVLAPNFESFARGLVDCSRYAETEADV